MEILAIIKFLFLVIVYFSICGFGLYLSLVYLVPKIHDYFLFKNNNKKDKK